ncbi:MAG: acyltransferase family protein [Microthrixaceae bacterium]
MGRTTWWRDQLELGRGGSSRLASMEGLRGLAVLLVFFVHYADRVMPWVGEAAVTGALARRIGDAGNIGVDLFFVLSGFLIYGNLMDREQAYRPFIRRRMRRLYPTFLVVLGAYVVLAIAMPSASPDFPRNPLEMIPYVGVNALFLPGIVPVDAFITVAWSLSYEVFFYLTVPVFISKLHLRTRTSPERVKILRRFAIGTLLLGGLISGTHPRLSMFFGGMLLWEWLRYRWPEEESDPAAVRRIDRLSTWSLPVALAVSLMLLSSVLQGLPRIAAMLVLWPILCAGCFAVDGRMRRWFSWTPLRYLGNISYSYYLIHSLVLQGFFLGLEQVWAPDGEAGWAFWVLMIPVFVLTVAGALALFLLVEKPFSLDRRSLHPRTLGRRPA